MNTLPAWMLKSAGHSGLVEKAKEKAKKAESERQARQAEAKKAANAPKPRRDEEVTTADSVGKSSKMRTGPRLSTVQDVTSEIQTVDPILAYMREYYDSYKAPQVVSWPMDDCVKLQYSSAYLRPLEKQRESGSKRQKWDHGKTVGMTAAEAATAVMVPNTLQLCRCWPDGRVVQIEVTPREPLQGVTEGAQADRKHKDMTHIVQGLSTKTPAEAKMQMMLEIAKAQPFTVPKHFPNISDGRQVTVGEALQLLKACVDTPEQSQVAQELAAEGWAAAWAKEYCCFYYTNMTTGASTWERPKSAGEKEKEKEAAARTDEAHCSSRSRRRRSSSRERRRRRSRSRSPKRSKSRDPYGYSKRSDRRRDSGSSRDRRERGRERERSRERRRR